MRLRRILPSQAAPAGRSCPAAARGRSARPVGAGLFALAAALAVLHAASPAQAEDPVITVEAKVEPAAIAVGETGKLTIDVRIPPTFHLWSLDPGPGPAALVMNLAGDGPLAFEGPWHGPEPLRKHDRGFGRELGMYEGTVRFERAVRVARAPKDGEAATLAVRGQICTDDVCVGQRLDVKLPLTIAAAPTGVAKPALAGSPLSERTTVKAAEPAGVAAPAVVEAAMQTAGAGAGLEKAKAEGVLSFLLLAFLAGLGALVTPCVFPAIPLTVSFFSKYSEEGFGRGARLAAVYAATMVATFTIAGVLISVFFGVTGVQDFASHPMFNLVLALTLVFFAMNLLGWFEIGVPGFVLAFVNKLESSYGRNAILGDDASAKRSGMTDYVVVVVAAITATTVFFTCTVAFVGIVLVAAAQGEWFWPTIGMLAFSSAFALPFFLLAMFPQAAHRLRGKSGSWLTATRVTLGFLELAAAMKFLSNADLVWQLGLVTRDLVLALWIPLFALAGLFLLGKLKLGEDVTGGAEEHPSVPRVLASTVMFGLSIYLAAGLFNGRPFGGWIDGWLPPVVYPGKAAPVMAGAGGAQPTGHAFAWETDLAAGRARAQREQKLVFVNYTGYTCTNCRYMEGAVFPLPEIAGLLNGMVLVELYTDGGTPEQDRNRDDQVKRFNTAALPLYSVERADGTVLGTFASSTNDPAEFRRFLEEAIAKGKGTTAVLANGEVKAAEPETAEPPLVLRAQRLSDGGAAKVIEPGRWTLINFWATWCGPCIEELKEFLVARGRAFEKDGGRFVTIAFDEASDLPKAKALMTELGVAADHALYVAPDATDAVDARFGFDGATLPYTVLVSPSGEVVWKHRAVLSEPELDQKLVCFAGPKGATNLPPDPKKCSGSAAR